MARLSVIPATEQDLFKIVTNLRQVTEYLNRGNLEFQATQVPSTDANTLDDYEEGDWVPTLTFATPGDLSVTYATRTGKYTKIGRAVILHGQVITSAFTHTTASGQIQFTGLPFVSAAGQNYVGATAFAGITKATYTQVGGFIVAGAQTITFFAFGSGVAVSPVVVADMPTGGTVNLSTTIIYHV